MPGGAGLGNTAINKMLFKGRGIILYIAKYLAIIYQYRVKFHILYEMCI